MISPNKKMKNRPLFIGPESDLFIALSLTHSRLVNLIDATLACEDAKLPTQNLLRLLLLLMLMMRNVLADRSHNCLEILSR